MRIPTQLRAGLINTLMATVSCSLHAAGFVDTATPTNALPTSGGTAWSLVFSDEFNAGTLDTSKWGVDVSASSRAPRNDRGISDWWWVADNVSLNGSNLVLDVEKLDTNTMHCGSISSDGIYEPLYGYMEARIRIADNSKDTHTAFWLQGPNMGNVDGTGNDGAEIDIFESAWFGDYTKSVVHIDGYGASHQANTKQYSTPGIHSGYHIFGMEWTASTLKIYYDGILKASYSGIWVPQTNEYLWLSVGASFGDIGTFASEANGWLTSAYVDYVRVWQSSSNTPPVFSDDPLILSSATHDQAYSGTLAGSATDDDGDILGFSKLAGPSWLDITPNGAVTGTPSALNLGTNVWNIQVSDGNGAYDFASLEIYVASAFGGTPTMLVGDSLLNGNFNAATGTTVSFSETPVWQNTKGAQSQVATRADKHFDGSQNGTLNSGRGFGVDTGHAIAAGDVFDVQYVWRDEWNWVDGSDQATVALFITDDDTITGTRTDLATGGSGLSTANDTYETVLHEGLYTADITYTGKTIFAAVETTASGFARIDNFRLFVTPAISNLFAFWTGSHGMTGSLTSATNDYDGDGVNNLLEYALNGDPTNSLSGEAPAILSLLDEGGTNWVQYVHIERTTPGHNLTYSLQESPDLVHSPWTPCSNAVVLGEGTINADFKSVTNRIPRATGAGYLRLHITHAP